MKITNTSEILTTKLKILFVLGITLLSLPLISILIDPIFIAAKYVTRINKGSLFFKLMHRELEGAIIYSYVFNVTNAQAFLSGEDKKLKVQEVGPFTYQEYRNNDNVELDTEKGVMRFTPRMRVQFLPERSVADPRGFNLTLPNVAALAISTAVSSYPYITQLAFDILTRRFLTKSISNMDAHSLLWGYEEPLLSIAHNVMPGVIHFNKMGVLDRVYNNPTTRWETGSTNADRFQIKNIDGIPGLPKRGYLIPSKRTKCNTFEDTYEGFAYPPGLTPDTPIRAYRQSMCRILDLEFIGTKALDYGPKAFRYKFSNNTFSTGPKTECLCNKFCIDGVTDISDCFYGLNAALSNGHFLNSDPKLYERVEGIHPDVEKHGSEFLVDPGLGVALESKFTFQLNIVMDNSSSNPIFKPFANMVVPIAYFKIIQPDLKQDVKDNFKIIYLYAPYVLLTLEVLSAVSGLGIAAYVARLVLIKFLSPNHSIYLQVACDEKDTPFGNVLGESFGIHDENEPLKMFIE